MKTKLEFNGMAAQFNNGKIMYRLGDYLQPFPKLKDCVVTICAWHDRDKSLTKKIESAGYKTTHGICEKCHANEIKKKHK
jgi:hypothetical protein